MVGMFQAVFHNIMICRVFRMMKLDSAVGFETTETYLTPIAFYVRDLPSQTHLILMVLYYFPSNFSDIPIY